MKDQTRLKKAELLRRCGEDEKASKILTSLLVVDDVNIIAQSNYNLGIIAEHPERGKRNIPKAIQHYQTALDLGYAEAADDLANLYYFGTGVKKNVKKACEIWEEGFKLGSECAGFQLINHIFHFTSDFKHSELLRLIDTLLNRNASWKSLYYTKFNLYSDKSWDGYNINEAIKNLKIYAEMVGDFGYRELVKMYTTGEHVEPNPTEANRYAKMLSEK